MNYNIVPIKICGILDNKLKDMFFCITNGKEPLMPIQNYEALYCFPLTFQ